jgi:hypothetical protein
MLVEIIMQISDVLRKMWDINSIGTTNLQCTIWWLNDLVEMEILLKLLESIKKQML